MSDFVIEGVIRIPWQVQDKMDLFLHQIHTLTVSVYCITATAAAIRSMVPHNASSRKKKTCKHGCSDS